MIYRSTASIPTPCSIPGASQTLETQGQIHLTAQSQMLPTNASEKKETYTLVIQTVVHVI
jgi:hypothetical protein